MERYCTIAAATVELPPTWACRQAHCGHRDSTQFLSRADGDLHPHLFAVRERRKEAGEPRHGKRLHIVWESRDRQCRDCDEWSANDAASDKLSRVRLRIMISDLISGVATPLWQMCHKQ